MAESTPGSALEDWLKHVDSELIPQAVEHLKLGLYSELAPHYVEAKDIQEPSVLYQFLLERCLQNNHPKCLKIFLHVLRALGSSLKGRQLVGEAFGVNSPYRIEDPGVLDVSKMSVNFKFFQCLLKIATHARKVALGEQLMKRFCKERFLNRNYRQLKGMPELFISLHQAQFIAADFTHHLVEALSKYKSWVCVQHINDYHKNVGLRSVVFTDAHPGVFSSSVESSHNRDLSVEWAGDAKRHRSSKDLDLVTAFNDVPVANGHPQHKRTSKPNEPPSYHVIETSDTDHLIRNGYGIQNSYCSTRTETNSSLPGLQFNRKKNCAFFVTTGVLLALFVVVMLVVFGSTVWLHVIRPPSPSKVSIRQGSTVILGDFNTFYYEDVYIGIDDDHYPNITSDDNFILDLYGVPGACADICCHGFYTKDIFVMFTEKNITEFIPIYALVGSSFSFDLSGGASQPASKSDLVEVCAYVGATYGSGTKIECIKVPISEGFGNYDIVRPGYYYVTVQPLNGPVKFSFSLTGKVKRLHVSIGELLSCGLNNSVSACSVPLPFTGKEYCLMAEFYRLPYNYLRTELDVRVESTRVGVVIGVTIPPLIGCVILFLLLTCIFRVVCIKCCWKISGAEPLHSLTYSI